MSDTSDKKVSAFRFLKPVGNVVLGDSSASLLLMFLCWAANSHTGESWHSQSSIKSRTGMGLKTIRRATRTLETLGLVTCECQGKKTNLQYRVDYNKLVELAEAGKILCAERRKLKQAGGSVSAKSACATVQQVPMATVQKVPITTIQKVPTNLVIQPRILTTKEPDAGAFKNSGSISEIEATLAKLLTRKKEAISGGNFTQQCPNTAAYNTLTDQIQECQMELNFARGRHLSAALEEARKGKQERVCVN